MLILFGLACKKNNFQTNPTIKIKDINTTVVAINGELRIRLTCTDKEGDEGEGELTYIRVRTNIIPIPQPGMNDQVDTVHTVVPAFPKTDEVEMFLNIPYNFLNEDPNKNDTMFFKFTLRDNQNHQSDTISSVSIVAKQL